MKPSIGRIVHYQTDGRGDISYEVPAIITCTKDSYVEGGDLEAPLSENHVHLECFSPGENGTYSELNVPFSDGKDCPSMPSRTWHWPERD